MTAGKLPVLERSTLLATGEEYFIFVWTKIRIIRADLSSYTCIVWNAKLSGVCGKKSADYVYGEIEYKGTKIKHVDVKLRQIEARYWYIEILSYIRTHRIKSNE